MENDIRTGTVKVRDFSMDYLRAGSGGSRHELFLYDDYGHAAYDFAPDYKERLLKFFRD